MFFAFLGGDPQVVVSILGLSSGVSGPWFAVTSIGYMAGNFFAARWSVRFGIDRMIRWGTVLSLTGAVIEIALIMTVTGGGPAVIFPPQILLSFGSGLLLPNPAPGGIIARPP